MEEAQKTVVDRRPTESEEAASETAAAREGFAFDRASVRSVDENGFLHILRSHITKAGVNPYYGREIPGAIEHGYDPEGIYYGFRPPEELEKSLSTWEGLPVHALHHMDSADDPQKASRVGAVGTDVVWADPYVDAPLTIWDGGAIDAIESGALRELSCAYRYEPEFQSGEYEGSPYDFIMRSIRGNHVAIVEEGRAGPDVLVADAALGADELIWRTTSGGKRYQLDTESGEITKGEIGQNKEEPDGGSPQGEEPSESGPSSEGGSSAGGAPAPALPGTSGGSYSTMSEKELSEIARQGVDPAAPLEERVAAEERNIAPILSEAKACREELAALRDEMNKFARPNDRAAFPDQASFEAAEAEREKNRAAAWEKLAAARTERKGFLDAADRLKRRLDERKRAVLKAKYAGVLPAGQEPILRPLAVKAQTAKAVLVSQEGRFDVWIPKSQTTIVDGRVIGGRPWIFEKSGLSMDQQPEGDEMERQMQRTDAAEGPGFGAQVSEAPADAAPSEVDLAQAIIDLHKIDPTTGQIVDVGEDDAHAGELSAALGEAVGGVLPAKLARLVNAVRGLKFGAKPMPATPEDAAQTADVPVERIACLDEPPDARAPQNGQTPQNAQNGQSAQAPRPERPRETPQDARPASSASEKKDGGPKPILPPPPDTPDPEESDEDDEDEEAEESFDFGEDDEASEKEEREAAEKAGESSPDPIRSKPGGKPAAPVPPVRDQEFKEAMDRIGLDSEDPDAVKAFAEGVMYGERSAAEKDKPKGDAAPSGIGPEPAPELPPNPDSRAARDAAFRAGRAAAAQDAKTIRDAAVREAKEHIRSLYRAVETVKPLVGAVDALAFDSAEEVYAHALSQKGYDPKRTPRTAWRPMVEIMLAERNLSDFETIAGGGSAVRVQDGPDVGTMSRIHIS